MSRIRAHLPFALVLLTLSAAYLPWTSSELLGGLDGDSAVYLMTARLFAPGAPADIVAEAFAAESQIPPLYPALLGLTGAVEPPRAHAVTTLCFLAAFAAFYVWLLGLGVAPGPATATVAALAVLPGTVSLVLPLYSEGLYLALSLAGLALLSRAAQGRGPPAFWFAALCISAAMLTRTAGITLIPALAVELARRRPVHAAWMLSLAIAPAAAWALAHRPAGSYSATLFDFYAQMGPGLADWLVHQVRATTSGFLNLFPPAAQHAGVLLGAVGAMAGAVRLRRGEPDAVYALLYLALILAWPFPAQATRFTWVLLPLLIGYAAWAAHRGAMRLAPRLPAAAGWVRWSVPAVLCAVAVPGALFTVQRYFDPWATEHPQVRSLPEWYARDAATARLSAELHVALATAIRDLAARVPPDDCVLSIKPEVVSYYAARLSFEPPAESSSDAEFAEGIARRGCTHVFLIAGTTSKFATSFYPRERLGDRLEVIAVGTLSQRDGQVITALGRLRP